MLGGPLDGLGHLIEGLAGWQIQAEIIGRLSDGADELDEPNMFHKRQVGRLHHERLARILHNDDVGPATTTLNNDASRPRYFFFPFLLLLFCFAWWLCPDVTLENHHAPSAQNDAPLPSTAFSIFFFKLSRSIKRSSTFRNTALRITRERDGVNPIVARCHTQRITRGSMERTIDDGTDQLLVTDLLSTPFFFYSIDKKLQSTGEWAVLSFFRASIPKTQKK